ncbi:flagellar type III secretion system pore protein FliP [Natranaerobius thermophilus]|uniref:Flagellar biosynthetic protein FliP n=1 Tax=Natranaerobius thermophilus (strain ATCC BAA-1301 / DSM 18059 / JW/NM-WN-LF) TaxID=457570 RepID=B2A362_NATTJ|nr:flagellar type III secretion system pore protein FliP [Natranaerobius thermophilus]ACB84992.1 flagellar biosynthetic protein FliP [Natranaerobius thermophilus JW/NM-WN-LF]
MVKDRKTLVPAIIIIVLILLIPSQTEAAQPFPIPNLELEVGEGEEPEDLALTLQIIILLTILSLAPALLILTTSFTRVVIVLSFIRNALATQQMPPNQVLIGLALFLTFFIMSPVWGDVYQEAWEPYREGDITQEEAIENGLEPVREFMYQQTREDDLALFVEYSDIENPATIEDVPTHVIIPAFVISELKTAFQIGFMIFVPFLIIDMIVASTLMSMGMLMLPPVMISLPFKVLLFVLVDGWFLITRSLLISFG